MFGYEQQVISAVNRVLPSVVSVVVAHEADTLEHLDPKNAVCVPNRNPGKNITVSGGSGVVVSKDLVVTNKHVVMDATATYAVFDQSGVRHDAEVIARDPIKDIALLRTVSKKSALPPAPLGSASNLALGQTVIAIGNALGEFQSTVSTGVISGLSRFVTAVTDGVGHQERLRGLIQTDAAINAGNSGGPLIDSNGKVIGINTAVISGAQNIGFAIPINHIVRDIKDIKRYGHIARPFLGIRYILLDTILKKKYKLEVSYGAMVVRENIPGDVAVIAGSPADKAKIKEGDILLSINNQKISKTRTVEDLLEHYEPDETLSIEVLRGKKRTLKKLTLTAWK